MSVQAYLDLITSEHQDKPKFMGTVSFSVALPVQVQSLLNSMMNEGGIFDLSLPPVGNQLDIIGQWVGASRDIAVPVVGVYFTWDDTVATGWDVAIWQPQGQPTTLVTLPDDIYLILIHAKIALNNWDGTTEGAYAAWQILLSQFGLNLLIQDNQNMSMLVALQGGPVNALTQTLLTQGYLPLKPEGVRISGYVLSIDTNPLMAWDAVGPYLDGWDSGSWGQEI